MDDGNRMPPRCPSCGTSMRVVRLECPGCGTSVSGDYGLCPVCRLEGAHREVFDLFIQARGNIKDVQREMGLSYPTARQRVDDMFRGMGQGPRSPEPSVVLTRLKNGEISVEEAERLLRAR